MYANSLEKNQYETVSVRRLDCDFCPPGILLQCSGYKFNNYQFWNIIPNILLWYSINTQKYTKKNQYTKIHTLSTFQIHIYTEFMN